MNTGTNNNLKRVERSNVIMVLGMLLTLACICAALYAAFGPAIPAN